MDRSRPFVSVSRRRAPGPPRTLAADAIIPFSFSKLPWDLAPPSSPPLQPCVAVAPVVAVAREGRRRGRRRVAVLVRPSIVAVDRRSTAVIVKPKVAAASSSTPSPSVDLPPPFWSPVSSPRRSLRAGALRSCRRAVVRRPPGGAPCPTLGLGVRSPRALGVSRTPSSPQQKSAGEQRLRPLQQQRGRPDWRQRSWQQPGRRRRRRRRKMRHVRRR